MISVQVASAGVVGQVLAGKNLDRILESILAKNTSLTPNERAAVQSISFDTLRHYGLLSSQLDMLLTAPVADAAVRHLLLVSLAQLQFSKASAHAIVDHAVSACQTMGLPRAKGLINAVLRNFLREPEKFKRERFKQEVARYDFPMWWIKRLKRESPSQWESILLSARVHPPMSLRINCRKVSIPEYLAVLERHGIKAKAFGDNAVMLEKPMPVVDVPGFREGHVSVQDIGAQGAARLLAPRAGMRVLDACAAPGGKTGHLLEMADIDLTAIDSDRFRMKRVSDNLHRLGLHATLHVADAADISAWWDGKPFDRILLDVPCSGSGVVRRHPDIKWIRRESDLAGFARQQEKLLDALWNCLAVGGRLLYATCSVFRSENQDVVTRFLKTKTDVVPLDLAALTANEDVAVRLNEDGQLLPDDHHDGFFYALLEKAA